MTPILIQCYIMHKYADEGVDKTNNHKMWSGVSDPSLFTLYPPPRYGDTSYQLM